MPARGLQCRLVVTNPAIIFRLRLLLSQLSAAPTLPLCQLSCVCVHCCQIQVWEHLLYDWMIEKYSLAQTRSGHLTQLILSVFLLHISCSKAVPQPSLWHVYRLFYAPHRHQLLSNHICGLGLMLATSISSCCPCLPTSPDDVQRLARRQGWSCIM